MSAYLIYIKIGAVILVLALAAGAGYHFGGLASRAALDAQEAAQSQTTANAVLAERASALAQAKNDQSAQATHDQDLAKINSAPISNTPVIVYRPGALCAGTVPGAEAQAGGIPANSEGGRADPGPGVNIRAALNALEVKYETVLVDYRRLDADWPR